jgi:hypothetical protein
MMMSIECPDVLFPEELLTPAAMTGDGARLEAVEDEPAGPWLAAVLAGVDVASLSEWDLPAYLRACARVQSWAAALVSDAVAELASRPGAFGADKEVALALCEPVGAAQRRIHHARRLRRWLPTTRRLFRAGMVSERQVDAIVETTAAIDDVGLARAVEERVLTGEGACSRTARELARAARRVLARLDPAGAQDRASAAREQADVSFYPGEDGTAATVIDGPVEQALLVKTAADAYAATQKAAGDSRLVGVLRCEGVARMCEDYLTGTNARLGAPRSGGRPVEIGVVVGLDTALGRHELPGEIPGVGIIPRDVIAGMVADEGARLRLLVIDETTGRLVHRAVDAYRPTAEQIAHVRAEYVYSTGPGSQVLAGRSDVDHAIPHPDGLTQIGNLIPNDRTWHNGHTRQQLRVTVDDSGTVHWTSVLGQTRTVTPYDYRGEPEAGTPSPAADGPVDESTPPPF